MINTAEMHMEGMKVTDSESALPVPVALSQLLSRRSVAQQMTSQLPIVVGRWSNDDHT